MYRRAIWFGSVIGGAQRTQRTGVRDALVGPVMVVEGLEFAQVAQEVMLVSDQRALEELTPAGTVPILSHS